MENNEIKTSDTDSTSLFDLEVGGVKFADLKAMFVSAQNTTDAINFLKSNPIPYAPPEDYSDSVSLEKKEFQGWPVYEVASKNSTSTQNIVYFHGGGWFYEIGLIQWDFIKLLALKTSARIIVPIYTLVPHTNATDVVSTAANLVEALSSQSLDQKYTLMGDSAGGNICFATLQEVRNRNIVLPHQTVLISPCMDISFSDPRMDDIEALDPMLARAGLRVAGNLYKGDLPSDDFRVSPIFGNLSNLGKIHLYSGTHDIVNIDAKRLVDKFANVVQGTTLIYREEQGMVHIYPLIPTLAEGQSSQDEILNILNDE